MRLVQHIVDFPSKASPEASFAAEVLYRDAYKLRHTVNILETINIALKGWR